jgi:hypothetical protein
VSNGWAKSPSVEAEIAAWFDAKTLEEERSAAQRLNEVECAPLGWYLRYFAWTKDLAGVTQGPLPFFWGSARQFERRCAGPALPAWTGECLFAALRDILHTLNRQVTLGARVYQSLCLSLALGGRILSQRRRSLVAVG